MEELTMTYEQAVAFLKKYMEENGRKQVEVAAELGRFRWTGQQLSRGDV